MPSMVGGVLQVLIVEDQFLIAKQLEFMIRDSGHIHVGTAATRPKAYMLARDTKPDIAFVDLSLADGPTGLDVARDIAAVSGAKILFLTANRRRLPAGYHDAIGVLEKPFTRSTVMATLRFLALHIGTAVPRDGGPAKPNELDLSPLFDRLWRSGGCEPA